jgi:hypothetical protein
MLISRGDAQLHHPGRWLIGLLTIVSIGYVPSRHKQFHLFEFDR